MKYRIGDKIKMHHDFVLEEPALSVYNQRNYFIVRDVKESWGYRFIGDGDILDQRGYWNEVDENSELFLWKPDKPKQFKMK